MKKIFDGGYACVDVRDCLCEFSPALSPRFKSSRLSRLKRIFIVSMQQRLDSDVGRVSSALRGDLIIINARSMDQQHTLTVAPGDQIFAAVGGAFGNVSDTSLTVKHTVPASFAHTYREAREDSELSPLLLIC